MSIGIMEAAGIPNLTADPHGQNGLNRYESMQEDTKGEKLRYENESFRIRRCMYEVKTAPHNL
jgi:hypothetical protein